MAHHDPTSPAASRTPEASADASDRGRLLHAFVAAQGAALTIGDLRELGVRMPGQALYELELDGYPVERAHERSGARAAGFSGYRLGAPASGARER